MEMDGIIKRKGYNMNNWIRLPGFPPPKKQDSVKFYVFKDISYSYRMMLYLILLAVGFLFQILLMKALPGAIFLVCATLLNLVQGYDSRIKLKDFKEDNNWTQVDMKQINQVLELERKAANWDKDILDISNGKGIFAFMMAIFLTIFGNIVLKISLGYEDVGIIFITDVIILLLPLWFNGLRRVLKQDILYIKVNIIKSMEEFFRNIKKDGEIFKPALMLARDKSGKSVPKDSRFTITFENMPEDFYGIQAQININEVQNSNYPYFYCVIAAKSGFGLRQHAKNIVANKKVIVQYEEDRNAEVIVIRHRTTNTTGYHTNIRDCKGILEIALTCARDILASLEK